MRATRDDPGLVERLDGLLGLGDPDGEVAFAYAIKEATARFYDNTSREAAEDFLRDIIDHATKPSAPPDVKAFGRTLKNWFDPILAWHQARVSNGPTEGMNNLLKRVKRVAFGFTNFENFRIRALLYAGKPNLRTLDSIVIK